MKRSSSRPLWYPDQRRRPGQSSVTVYGRLNESVERQKDGDTSITALQNNASRIGFKGTEDLGGGLEGFVPDRARSTPTPVLPPAALPASGVVSWVA